MKQSTRLLKCKNKLEIQILVIFRNDRNFVTAGKKGNIALWKNQKIVKTVKLFKEDCWPIMKRKNGEIVATGKDDKVYVLNDELTVKQQFNGHYERPNSIDFDVKLIVIGYSGGMVHLHNRRNNDRKKAIINFKINLIK